MSRSSMVPFKWRSAITSKPVQGVRVLLMIVDNDLNVDYVVGYWGCGAWEVCTNCVTSHSNVVVYENFEQDDVNYWMYTTGGETP